MVAGARFDERLVLVKRHERAFLFTRLIAARG
jgi:hypothetical protein